MAFLEQLFHSQIACSTVISGAQLNGGLYLCLTRKRHLHLRTLLEYFFFVHIFTTKQGCFPILHGNLLSHHINLSFPLRKKDSACLSFPPHKHLTVRTSSTTNTNGIPRHSSLLWSMTAHHCLREVFSATCCGHVES